MKILVAMPCLFNADATKRSIDSILDTSTYHSDQVDLLIIDNGSDQEVKSVINYAIEKIYGNNEKINEGRLKVIWNQKNIYVNPAWNQAMKYFLEKGQWDVLCIANSDFIMHKDWAKALSNIICTHPNSVPIPAHIDDVTKINQEIDLHDAKYQEVTSGTAGVFIILKKAFVEYCYPIPEQIKIWFGDNWIYDGLRSIGVQTKIFLNLQGFHLGSQNVSRLPEAGELIEMDKMAWANELLSIYKEEFARKSNGLFTKNKKQ